MDFLEKLADQCKKPTGIWGRLLGRLMNLEHRSLRRWGLGLIAVKPTDKVLDIGCGGGKTLNSLSSLVKKERLYGIDYSIDMVRLSNSVNRTLVKNNRAFFQCASVTALPFVDDYFDVVTAFETTFFWPDLVNNLKEVNRVIRNNGVLLIVNDKYKKEEPLTEKDRNWLEIAGIVLYSPEEYDAMLKHAGFHHVTVTCLPEQNRIAVVAEK